MQITKTAVEQFKKMLKTSEIKNPGIRLFISRVGCCGTSFGLDVSEKGKTGDKTVNEEGITFYIPADACETLSDVSIDYSESATGGFTISNISRTSCCG